MLRSRICERVDEVLGRAMDQVGAFALKLGPINSLFEAMLRSIVYQQLHGKAAGSIHRRVTAELAPHGGVTPEALMMVPDEALRGAGLSANKLLAARGLAQKSLDGTVPKLKEAYKLTDAELMLRLTEVRGIGPWTVHMLLIFYLGRPDVLPTGRLLDPAGFQTALSQTGKIRHPTRSSSTPAAGNRTGRWRAGIYGGRLDIEP